MYVITASSPSTVTFGSANDLASGKTIASFSTITVKCNYNWQLGVKASTANFNATGGGASTNMPAGILKLKKSTSGSYLTVTTSSQTLATGSRGPTSASGNSFTVDALIEPGFSYNGGTYSIVLTYTLTRQ
jgi:hypothetical protein